jgi:hypothetical protein
VPYAKSVRTNSLEQFAQIATPLTASGVISARDSSYELSERLSESTWAEDRRWRGIRPPDGGRWWQMLGHGAKFNHKKEQALLSHRNVEEMARTGKISSNTLLRCLPRPQKR